jgi:Family of unknown function (DUF6283)
MPGKTQRQCKKCPWKVSTDPREIPNGYDLEKHKRLGRTTIADETGFAEKLMGCHESPVSAETPCVGWLHNQLGPGNNFRLRWEVARGRISGDYELDGPQHATFADTLPRR